MLFRREKVLMEICGRSAGGSGLTKICGVGASGVDGSGIVGGWWRVLGVGGELSSVLGEVGVGVEVMVCRSMKIVGGRRRGGLLFGREALTWNVSKSVMIS